MAVLGLEEVTLHVVLGRCPQRLWRCVVLRGFLLFPGRWAASARLHPGSRGSLLGQMPWKSEGQTSSRVDTLPSSPAQVPGRPATALCVAGVYDLYSESTATSWSQCGLSPASVTTILLCALQPRTGASSRAYRRERHPREMWEPRWGPGTGAASVRPGPSPGDVSSVNRTVCEVPSTSHSTERRGTR